LNDFMKLGENLRLNNKQMNNSLVRFSKQLDKVIMFVENSFLTKELQIDYKESLIERAERLNLL